MELVDRVVTHPAFMACLGGASMQRPVATTHWDPNCTTRFVVGGLMLFLAVVVAVLRDLKGGGRRWASVKSRGLRCSAG